MWLRKEENGLPVLLPLDILMTLATGQSSVFADEGEGSLGMVKGLHLLPACGCVTGLTLPANNIVVVVGMTAYARLREAEIGLPPTRLYFCQQLGVWNVLWCVAGAALDGAMLARAGEACRSMIKGLLIE